MKTTVEPKCAPTRQRMTSGDCKKGNGNEAKKDNMTKMKEAQDSRRVDVHVKFIEGHELILHRVRKSYTIGRLCGKIHVAAKVLVAQSDAAC